MKLLFFSLILSSAIVAKASSANGLSVSNAYIKRPIPGVNVSAGYFTIENTEDKDHVLTTITVKEFKKTEMHETLVENGSSSMRKLSELVLPAKSKTEFSPGGRHLMLFSPTVAIQTANQVEITIGLKDGRKMTLKASIK
jgi:copper(I)-binding protein